jgi:hypothetical protein
MGSEYGSSVERYIMYINLVFSATGLVCNLLSLSYFIRRREELGNAFLTYLNGADAIVCVSMLISFIASILVDYREHDVVDYEFGLVTSVVALNAGRCSLSVTGIITIYLNIIRTSAIIWPMVRFKKRLLHVSLIVLIIMFVALELTLAVVYTYPTLNHSFRKRLGLNTTAPFQPDDPLRSFVHRELQALGVPIIVVVAACCIASTAKLLTRDDLLSQIDERDSRRKAALTVLILSVQYVVLNASVLILFGLESHYDRQRALNENNVHIRPLVDNLLLHFGLLAIVLNSALNPIIYFLRVKKLRKSFADMARVICHGKDCEMVNKPAVRNTNVHENAY